MKKLFSISGITLIILSSCINNKYIYKSNTLYRLQPTPAVVLGPAPAPAPVPTPLAPIPPLPPTITYELNVRSPNSGFKATISDKGDYLVITPVGTPVFTDAPPSPIAAPTGWRWDNITTMYFPETKYLVTPRYKLTYFETTPVLQALSIPLKIRPQLTNKALLDSFPSQAEASFNVGVSFGWKFTHCVYNSRKNIFGQNTNKYSLAPGIFLGTGAVDLTKENTRNPVITFPRKAALITTGGFIMLGFNGFNIGYAVGVDFATGTKSEQWLYQGKMWHGIIFAIDLLK